MHFLVDNEILSIWLMQYGSIILFILLILGIIILPIPEETMMVVAGVLMNQESLNIPFTIMAAYAGSICGISLSYLIGRTIGLYFVTKYGGWIGITEKHLQVVHHWFERFGKWSLMIGYFIPGIRHFTGFSSGMTKMKFKHFALFAYSGAIIWVSMFLSLGYFFSSYYFSIFEKFEINIETMITFGLLITLFYICYSQIKKRLLNKIKG